jgi:hypothetical protein
MRVRPTATESLALDHLSTVMAGLDPAIHAMTMRREWLRVKSLHNAAEPPWHGSPG